MQRLALFFSRPRLRVAPVVCLLTLAASAIGVSAQNYSFSALQQFAGTNGTGNTPFGNVVMDSAGDLYGTLSQGGAYGLGTVFELVDSSGTYTQQTLHTFQGLSNPGQPDGGNPQGGLLMDSEGDLFGTTLYGGTTFSGTVFELKKGAGNTFSYSVLYSFSGAADGQYPAGTLVSDSAGNLYGATRQGGAYGSGTLFELVSGGGAYTEKTLYTFTGANDGSAPYYGVILDPSGDVFGTTRTGGSSGVGTVFELANVGGGNYNLNTLYSFEGGLDGSYPSSIPTMDAAGNLYGTTQVGGNYGGGTVFELQDSNGTYTKLTLHQFAGSPNDGSFPYSAVVLDAAGNLYGTTSNGGSAGYGTVFEMAESSTAPWPVEVLHSFSYSGADQGDPYPGLLIDSHGNLYGASTYGASGGAVWELQLISSTSMQLTSSLNPAASTDNITFTATLTPSPSTALVAGTVTFSAGSSAAGSTALGTETVANGSASITVSASGLGVGVTSITAQFTPSSAQQTGSSGVLSQAVNSIPTAVLSGNNTFTGNQSVNGSVSATSFSGNGAALTNVVAAGLNCAGCVTNSQLGVDYAGSSAQGGPANNALLLGGLPAASFATVDSNSFTGDQSIGGSLLATGNLSAAAANFSGTVSTGGVQVAPVGTATAAQGFNSGAVDASASVFNSSAGAQNLLFRWQAEPVAASNNTASPAATLNLLYGAKSAPAETGLSVNANGTLNFAAGQTFPGASSGTITAVNAGAGLNGGGDAGAITLSLSPNACAPGSAITGLPFACSPFVTSGSNVTFGIVAATSFSGNGAGLANVQAASLATGATVPGAQVSGPVASATTAAGLTGSISESQVANLAGDLAGAVSTSESFATTAANAAQANAETYAGGLAASSQSGAVAAAESYANKTFVPLAGGTLTGAITLSSLNATSSLSGASVAASGPITGGSLAIGGGTAITEFVSVTTNITLPPIRPSECTTFTTAPLAGFTPGDEDTISLGVPRALLTDLVGNPGPMRFDPFRAMNHGPKVFLVYQAWETDNSQSTTVTLQVCNPGGPYPGGDSGTVRIDIAKH